jgi:hypothetical protein
MKHILLPAWLVLAVTPPVMAQATDDPYELMREPWSNVPRPAQAPPPDECDAVAAKLTAGRSGLIVDTSPPPLQTQRQIALKWVGGGPLAARDKSHSEKLEAIIECSDRHVGMPLDLAISWTGDPSPPAAFFDFAGRVTHVAFGVSPVDIRGAIQRCQRAALREPLLTATTRWKGISVECQIVTEDLGGTALTIYADSEPSTTSAPHRARR